MVEASVCKTDLSGFESRRYLQFAQSAQTKNWPLSKISSPPAAV